MALLELVPHEATMRKTRLIGNGFNGEAGLRQQARFKLFVRSRKSSKR